MKNTYIQVYDWCCKYVKKNNCQRCANTLRWNAPRIPQQLEDHYEANSWLSREPLSWPRPLSGIPAAMNHGEQSAIEVTGCGLTCLLWRQNTTPVILGVKPSFELSFCLFWCEISCSCVRFFVKITIHFLNFSTGNVCELTSHSHHSGWATWAGLGAGHSTEWARAWDSGSISPPDRRKVTFLRPPVSGRFLRNETIVSF